MAVYKKSTPKKTEIRVIPDEEEGVINKASEAAPMSETVDTAPGQLSVDVFQTADEIVVVAPVAGVTADEIEVSVTDDVLEIKGRRDLQLHPEDGDYFTRECFWGPFSRSIILPEAVDTRGIAATFQRGILHIRIPKTEKVTTRVVKIYEN